MFARAAKGLTLIILSELALDLSGEMTITNGKLNMSKNTSNIDGYGNTHPVSYAVQSPWVRRQSIEDNIPFGYPYNEKRSNANLNILEIGDQMEIGARWVSSDEIRAVYRTSYLVV